MSNSKLPNGGYALTNGSNYMLDGFHFDTEYGNGVSEKARLPEAKGLSALPSGMIPLDSAGASDIPNGIEAESHMDLEEMSKSANQLPDIIDHSWLAEESKANLEGVRNKDDVLEHFAEGRFEHPAVNQLKTLEECWGQRTTGLDIVPNDNRKVKVKKKETPVAKLPQDLVKRAMRELSYGQTPQAILDQIVGLSDDEYTKLASKLDAHYGLAGNVYIREADFPHLFSGKWSKTISKRCASAQYIIPLSEDCAFDRFLGMSVTKSIPWKKAYKSYSPKLDSYGVRKASGESFKTRLKNAFIDLGQGRVDLPAPSETWYETQLDPTEGVTLSEAKDALRESEHESFEVLSPKQIEIKKLAQRFSRISSDLVREGFITEAQASMVRKASGSYGDKIEILYQIASQPVSSQEYQGSGKQASFFVSDYKKEIGEVEPKHVTEGRKIAAQIDRYIAQGILSESEVDSALSLPSKKRYAALCELIKKGSMPKKAEYSGHNYTAHTQRTASAPKEDGLALQEKKVAKWVRQRMSEGEVGESLDELLRAKYSSEVLGNHESRIASLRSSHEGLSGHVYVDAEAYMTKGVEGCDKGALIHRANQIPTLLKTAKCNSCVFNSCGTCQKYNKQVVASVDEVVEDSGDYQREMIRLANASDSEKTAAMFNAYDPNEFNLSQDSNISLEESADHETISEVLFGGFDV